MKFIFLLIFFSVGVMAQVQNTSPLDERTPVKTDLAPAKVYDADAQKWYFNPCSNIGACGFALHKICIYDGYGKSHCECADGYNMSSSGECLSYCHEDINPCTGKDTCVEDIEDKAICLDSGSATFWNYCGDKTSASCGGVLLCEEHDLNGECIIVRTNYYGLNTNIYTSAKAINNWEAYFLNYNNDFSPTSNFIKQDGINYIQDELINFEYSNDYDKNYVIGQPKDYNSFLEVYGSSKPYILFKKVDYDTDILHYAFLAQGNINKNAFNSDFDILKLPYTEVYSPDYSNVSLVWGEFIHQMTNIITFLNRDLVFDGFIYSDTDLSNGLIICNDIECKGVTSHTASNDTGGSWEGAIINNSANIIYLHENWEAFACPSKNSKFTDCKIIEPNRTYDSLTEVMLPSSPYVESIIVQPKTQVELYDFYGQNTPYVTVYQDPNYRGNHITYVNENVYNNHIHNPRSVYKSGNLNVYLNIKEKDSAVYDNNNDEYITMTNSTPWEIEDSANSYKTLIVENGTHEIRNEGVDITWTDDTHTMYYRRHDFYDTPIDKDDIKSIKVNTGWEVYLCPDEAKEECKFFSESDDIRGSYSPTKIKYMLVQPKNHATMNRFYGHKEYASRYNGGLFGYVELYKSDDLEGEREIVLDIGVIEIGVNTIIKPEQVKGIRVVGGLKVIGHGELKTTNAEGVSKVFSKFKVNKNLPNSSNVNFEAGFIKLNLNNLGKLEIYSGHYPSVITHANLNANARSLAPGLVKYAPKNTIKAFYSNTGNYYPYLPNESYQKYWKEDEDQNKVMDNADFVYYAAHGSWVSGKGSDQDVLQNLSFVNYKDYLSEGTAMGDYETEWMITSACNGLGRVICDTCRIMGTIYNGIEACKGSSACIHLYETSEYEVFDSYKQHFANGLHGFGGMYILSHWIGTYYDESKEFWDDVDSHSIAYAWNHNFGSGTPERNAGYIAPGPCLGYDNGLDIPSYVHDDHFWGYGLLEGGTLPDPDRKFIKDYGYCYYAYVNYENRHYDFSQINHKPEEWIVLNESNQEIITESISNNLAIAFKIKKEDVFNGETIVSYNKEDKDNFLTVDYDVNSSIWDLELNDDSLIYSLKNNADIFYDNNIKNTVETYNYKVLNIDIALMADRHYDYSGNADNTANVYEVIFTFNLSNNGNPFLEENYIKIGVNPLNGEILSCKAKIMAVTSDSEVIDYKIIDTDYDNLVNQNGDNYYKGYYKKNNQYRPAIYDINKPDIEVVKVY